MHSRLLRGLLLLALHLPFCPNLGYRGAHASCVPAKEVPHERRLETLPFPLPPCALLKDTRQGKAAKMKACKNGSEKACNTLFGQAQSKKEHRQRLLADGTCFHASFSIGVGAILFSPGSVLHSLAKGAAGTRDRESPLT